MGGSPDISDISAINTGRGVSGYLSDTSGVGAPVPARDTDQAPNPSRGRDLCLSILLASPA